MSAPRAARSASLSTHCGGSQKTPVAVSRLANSDGWANGRRAAGFLTHTTGLFSLARSQSWVCCFTA